MSADEMPSDEEGENIVKDVFAKHSQLIEQRQQKLEEMYFDKMMFYLQCDMNLLIYGVGSTIKLMSQFINKCVYPEWPSIFVRSYNSTLMPRQILIEIMKYI